MCSLLHEKTEDEEVEDGLLSTERAAGQEREPRYQCTTIISFLRSKTLTHPALSQPVHPDIRAYHSYRGNKT